MIKSPAAHQVLDALVAVDRGAGDTSVRGAWPPLQQCHRNSEPDKPSPARNRVRRRHAAADTSGDRPASRSALGPGGPATPCAFGPPPAPQSTTSGFPSCARQPPALGRIGQRHDKHQVQNRQPWDGGANRWLYRKDTVASPTMTPRRQPSPAGDDVRLRCKPGPPPGSATSRAAFLCRLDLTSTGTGKEVRDT